MTIDFSWSTDDWIKLIKDFFEIIQNFFKEIGINLFSSASEENTEETTNG